MGSKEPDKCVFCGSSLEDYEYGRLVSNNERATSKRLPYHNLNICKDCIKELKILIEDDNEVVSE